MHSADWITTTGNSTLGILHNPSYTFQSLKNTVSKAIETRLERFRQDSRIQAGSLITTVFGDAILPRGGRVSLSSMIHLLQPLGVNERLVRTAVYRLVKEEWLQSEALGRKTDYMLTPSGHRRFAEASRQIYAADIPAWDRRWRLILIVGEVDLRSRESLRKALFWHGFGETATGSFVHPTADLEEVMESLVSEGFDAMLVQLMPLVAVNSRVAQCATDIDMVQKAWNLGGLALSYEEFLQMYEPIRDALIANAQEDMPEKSAFLIRTLLIHDVRRLLLRDPQLPESLLPASWPGSRARHLCRALYRKLLPLSERHLDANVRLSNGTIPLASQVVASRFAYGMDLEADGLGSV
ncbi:MAG: Phenylacetic acid degradation operon negative regulatory protein paaX [Polaromonas sp.]|nr:Phenylacetic acid degradation operon negative regulatory protein paaX [Polaromonas sp.]